MTHFVVLSRQGSAVHRKGSWVLGGDSCDIIMLYVNDGIPSFPFLFGTPGGRCRHKRSVSYDSVSSSAVPEYYDQTSVGNIVVLM
jgi:hypothetical protein